MCEEYKKLIIKDIKPQNWLKAAHESIDIAEFMWSKKQPYSKIPSAKICYWVHISISQYLELYYMFKDGTVVMNIDTNVLLKTLYECIAHDETFKTIQADCEIIALYPLEVTYPGGIKIKASDAKRTLRAGKRIEKFIKLKLEPLIKEGV